MRRTRPDQPPQSVDFVLKRMFRDGPTGVPREFVNPLAHAQVKTRFGERQGPGRPHGRENPADNRDVRHVGAQDRHRFSQKPDVFLRIRNRRAPESLDVGLVPHFPMTDAAREVARQCIDVIAPCLRCILPVIEGDIAACRIVRRIRCVSRLPNPRLKNGWTPIASRSSTIASSQPKSYTPFSRSHRFHPVCTRAHLAPNSARCGYVRFGSKW